MLPLSSLLRTQSAKVLVVDGQDTNRNLLSRILSSLAIEQVCSLVDYHDFKSHFLSFLPDLLVLDFDVPCGSAESIVEWLRLQPQGYLVPIIISGGKQCEGVDRALEKGANDYIRTPFVTAQVAVSINNLMQLSNSNYDAANRERFFDHRLQLSVKALQSEILQRNQVEQELHFQAHHEYHSRLPNRIFLHKVLEGFFTDNNRDLYENKTLAIFHLHQFNEINNTLGHSRADEILVEMALRFSALCQRYVEIIPLQYGLYDQAGPVALLDRTHFTIALKDTQAYRLEEIIEQLLTDSSQPLHYQGMQIETPISVGFASTLVDDDVTSWMRRAHVALEFAEQEKQPWAGYSEKADRYSQKKLTLVADLRNAIACDQGLFLHYQPQFDCRSGKILGVEVLLRWNHPIYGPLPADEIVALAEQTGLIQPLTHWVISHAFSQYQKVLTAGFEITLSINLSTLNLWQNNLLQDIAQQLELYDIPARQLILEVTETVLLKKPRRSLDFLRCLTALGIRIALDDFGTGFSSLAYLKKMPVSELKIDRSFIQELCYSHEDQVIVETIIAMCKGLGVEVVAEGVEDRATQLKLEALGCDRLQGYFLAKPLLGSDLLLRLASQ
ncbi:MAG: EAL domain-containing protein [Oleispira antarctica]|nr:EAL domain-containing protein [Oleispira antarctica]MBQ0791106.1 EAL domain-containing protein [Oleispira antarctica]